MMMMMIWNTWPNTCGLRVWDDSNTLRQQIKCKRRDHVLPKRGQVDCKKVKWHQTDMQMVFLCKYQNFKFYDIISDFCDDTCVWKALTWKQIIICRVHMAGRVLLAVFLCLAAIMEDQIEVEGWELEALEASLDCYKPTREIRGVCGY